MSTFRDYGDIPTALEEIAGILRESSALETMPRKTQIKMLCSLTGIDIEDVAYLRLLKQPNLTANQLAIQMGVSVRTLYRWPNVKRLLSKEKKGLVDT